MPRSLSTAVLAAIASKTVTLALFAELAFADNTIYAFSGVGTITPAGPPANPASTFPYGQTFTGLGWLAKVSAVPQTTKIQAQNVTLSLSGIPSNLLLEAINQVRITGVATLWLGFFNSSGALIADPVQLFSGTMDVPSLTDAGDTSTISISCENSLLSLNLAPNRQFDDADQQIYHPGDLGFSFVDKLLNLNLFWPSPDATTSPYPVSIAVTSSSVDIAVGGYATVEITVTYSDASTRTRPANTGSGPNFILGWASSNPKIAAMLYTTTNNVLGISPGECSIIARIPAYPNGSGGFGAELRAACNIFVHS
jgi:hypothetical protein